LELALVESIHKKQLFLYHIVQKLGLSDTIVLGERAENNPWRTPRPEGFDVVTCRATLSLADFARIGGPAVKSGGMLVAYKGGRYADELDQAEEAVLAAGLKHMAAWESPWGPGRLLAFQRAA
jgi:16S rRNA (guanine527-N7)-methyltransferase